MLQYDNSAFYFFALSTMSFYLLPSWFTILSRVIKAFKVDDESIGAVRRTTAEQRKAEELKKESKGFSSLKKKGFLINLAITIFLTALFVWLIYSVSSDGEVNSFDPFKILEIDHGADNKTIKKAYRGLSLKYHPDKNPGNRAAEAKFMMVSKAYEALTDDAARENWEKYGNPDGKQSLAVSIGLPSFLLDTANRNAVLITYLVIMVGLIPFCVYTYYSDSSKYGEKNVMYDTYAWYHHALPEHALIKTLPEVLAGSAEFRKRNVPSTSQDKQAIGQLAAQVRAQMLKPKYNHPVCVKGNVLLHIHLLRKTELLTSDDLREDLRYMLRMSTALMDAMIAVCQHQSALQTAINCIEFGQYMTQALWVRDSPLLQMPHFTAEEVKHCEKGKTKVTTIQQYREQPEDQRKGMVNFTDDQKADVQRFLSIYPDLTIESKVFVDDDEDDRVYEGDLCTIQVTIVRNHLKDGDQVGLVHAPFFPFPKKEAFWIILGQVKEGKIVSIEKIGNPNKKIIHRIKFMAPPKGTYEFDLLIKSNAYVGIDQKHKLTVETLDNATLPEYKVHPDDEQLDDEPTLFEEILNAHIEQDSDDEDDDDDDDEDGPGGALDPSGGAAAAAAAAAAMGGGGGMSGGDGGGSNNNNNNNMIESVAARKRAQLQKARRQQEDDSDDDDDDDDDDDNNDGDDDNNNKDDDAEEVYADK